MIKRSSEMLKKITSFLDKNSIVIFTIFFLIVFISYRELFNSYFEADEWYAFTYYLPLTKDPLGFIKIFNFMNTSSLIQVPHIVPLSEEIFFLNSLFFGTNFAPYVVISLLLHSVNSFLVFKLIRLYLPRKLIFAFLGGIFFALSSIHMGAITWAATYQTSVLPITFFLLSMISVKLGFLRKEKKLFYYSIIFLFLALLTKESALILFILLPIMVILEKRIFPLKLFVKLLLPAFIIYITFRFLIPTYYSLDSLRTQPKPIDTKTIVSSDLSIHSNLTREVAYRTITFPMRMIGSSFFPRQTVFSIVQLITPVVTPLPPGGNSIIQNAFLYSSGNYMVIYLASLIIFIFCLSSIFKFIRDKKNNDAQLLTIGLVIIILSALPLVAIIFSFPRWGYDYYFESRYYYNAEVGSAIVFPFLIFGISRLISNILHTRKISIIATIIFFNLAYKQHVRF